MRPTRRGLAVAAFAAVCVVLAAEFGARSLNAVVLPAVVALVAGALQAGWIRHPTVERRTPPDGFPGEGGVVELRFETDRPFTAAVADDLPAGLDGDATAETTVGVRPATYEIRYAARGDHDIGPVRFVATDVLGLFRRTFTVDSTDRVLVYPPVRTVVPAFRSELVSLSNGGDDRDEFDRLREYVRGDPLRDVHWKSTAKRDELVVKEFAAQTGTAGVSLSAGTAADTSGAGSAAADSSASGDSATGASAAERADAMAEAAASVGLLLLELGVPLRVSTPGGRIEASPGEATRLLEHLARARAGPVPEEEADVVVRAGERTTVAVDGREVDFEEVRADGEVRAEEAADASRDRAADPPGESTGSDGPPEPIENRP
ncbi:MAG: DUF58 domain-containing protein [Salinigranum sp.]